ncbi:MAG: hypothetical protein ABJB76_01470 [Candidatus Nitrosocosmicus sp.]
MKNWLDSRTAGRMSRLVEGINAGRHESYHKMVEYGFRTDIQGTSMQRYNEPDYNRSDIYFIDERG